MQSFPEQKRPGYHSEAVALAAAELLFQDYAEWCGGIEEVERTSALNEIAKAIRFEWDGYKIVRNLERYACIDGDEDLVEIMSCAVHHRSDARRAAVKLWVASHKVSPQFEIGTAVKHQHGRGIITRIETETAEYIVTPNGGEAGFGNVVPFEDCTLAQEAA